MAENDSGKATCSALLVIVDDAQMNGEMVSPPPTPQADQKKPPVQVGDVKWSRLCVWSGVNIISGLNIATLEQRLP